MSERPFASTGVKQPNVSPDKYVEAFAGGDMVTNPSDTNEFVYQSPKVYNRRVDYMPSTKCFRRNRPQGRHGPIRGRTAEGRRQEIRRTAARFAQTCRHEESITARKERYPNPEVNQHRLYGCLPFREVASQYVVKWRAGGNDMIDLGDRAPIVGGRKII